MSGMSVMSGILGLNLTAHSLTPHLSTLLARSYIKVLANLSLNVLNLDPLFMILTHFGQNHVTMPSIIYKVNLKHQENEINQFLKEEQITDGLFWAILEKKI